MKAPLQKSMFLSGKHTKLKLAVLALAVLFAGMEAAQAVPVSYKLTADALGLGDSDINKGGTVDPDMPGFSTSSAIGHGSVLSIQSNGLAGLGTVGNPVAVTITAQTRLDTLNGLPASNDYQAGIIFISKEKDDLPDGRKEGLGVRAFKVIGATGLREIDDKSGLAKIEGSKHVSGGTGPEAYDADSPNGAPHVDEVVNFKFNPALHADAMSVEVLLSDFEPTDVIDLHIELMSGSIFNYDFLTTSNSNIFEEIGDKLWKLKFDGISNLAAGDLIDSFAIRAIDDNPSDPRGTAEHFFITGMSFVPEPATIVLLGLGSLIFLRRRRG